jgi:hypothetical protein
MPLRLPGLAAATRGLAPGDVLLVRVLATSPQLELALYEVPSRSPAASVAPTPYAMQPDQLAQRRLSWRPPDAAALAHSWRTMVLDPPSAHHAETPPASRALVHGAHAADVAPAKVMPLGDSLVFPARDTPAHTLTGPPPWLYPAYAWGGLQIALRVVADDDDTPPRPRNPRRRGPLALRLETEVQTLGRVAVQIQLVMNGVQVVFFVEREHARRTVAQVLPTLVQALAAVELRLVRCGVVLGLPGPGSAMRWAWHGGVPSSALPPLLFRASAEVAVALSRFVPREGFSPVAR